MTMARILYWDEVLRRQLEREATPQDELMMVGRQSVPSSVTMAQARLALLAAGKLDAVAPAIEALPDPEREAARIKWEYAATVDRTDPFTALLGVAIGLDEQQMDELFIAASGM
jgi:hypothetical protein